MDDEKIARLPWEIDPAANNTEYTVTFRTSDGFTEAWVKWDGCIEYRRAFNIPFGEEHPSQLIDQIHICDIDEEIQLLIDLRDRARAYFGEGWDT